MEAKLIFWPMFVLILMSQLLYLPLVTCKIKAVKNRLVDRKKAALDANAWTEDVQKINNHLRNLFETPLLFYVLCITQYVTDQVTGWTVGLAWLYVLARLAHMFVHTRSNFVPLRMRLFASSMAILLVMTFMTMINL